MLKIIGDLEDRVLLGNFRTLVGVFEMSLPPDDFFLFEVDFLRSDLLDTRDIRRGFLPEDPERKLSDREKELGVLPGEKKESSLD